jgi:hypothetical protein
MDEEEEKADMEGAGNTSMARRRLSRWTVMGCTVRRPPPPSLQEGRHWCSLPRDYARRALMVPDEDGPGTRRGTPQTQPWCSTRPTLCRTGEAWWRARRSKASRPHTTRRRRWRRIGPRFSRRSTTPSMTGVVQGGGRQTTTGARYLKHSGVGMTAGSAPWCPSLCAGEQLMNTATNALLVKRRCSHAWRRSSHASSSSTLYPERRRLPETMSCTGWKGTKDLLRWGVIGRVIHFASVPLFAQVCKLLDEILHRQSSWT